MRATTKASQASADDQDVHEDKPFWKSGWCQAKFSPWPSSNANQILIKKGSPDYCHKDNNGYCLGYINQEEDARWLTNRKRNLAAKADPVTSPVKKTSLRARNAMLSMPSRGISPATRLCAPSALFH
jgi:hypothetical protein